MAQQTISDRRTAAPFDVTIEPEFERILEPKNRWPRLLGLSAAGLALVVVIGAVVLNFDAVAGMVGEAMSGHADAAAPALPDSPFVQHVKQAGLKACSNVFPVLGQMLTNGTKYEVQSSWNNHGGAPQTIQSLVGMTYATNQYRGPAAGVVFAAPSGSGCGGAMVRVVPFAASCAQIPALLPAKSVLANDFGQVAIYNLPGDGGQALLLPSGQSCVVISVASAATR